MISVMRTVGKISIDDLRVLATLASGSIPDEGMEKEGFNVFELQEHSRDHAHDQANLESNLKHIIKVRALHKKIKYTLKIKTVQFFIRQPLKAR